MKVRCRICGKSESKTRLIAACVKCWTLACWACMTGDRCKTCAEKETS